MKKKPTKSFTSFRIIGEKAQKLLAKAKQMNDEPTQRESRLPQRTKQNEIVVHLAIDSIVKATLAILGVAIGVMFLYMIRDKLVLLLLGIFVATIIDPGVQALRRRGVPRGLGVLIHYFIAIFLIIFLLVSLIPIISDQLQQIALLLNSRANEFLMNPQISMPFFNAHVNEQLTNFVKSTLESMSISHLTDAIAQFGQNLNSAAQGSLVFAAQLAGSVVGLVTSLVVVLVMAFFFQVEKEKIISWLRAFLPADYRSYVDDKSEVIHFKLGQWARGQLLLCLAIGTLVFFALSILGMPYALTLAMLAGFTEFIPVMGPLIAAIPSVLIAVTERGFIWGIVLIVVYYVIQWCENNLLVPLIMKRAVGLSPIAIMFAMLVGISFPQIVHPILGVMLAIPTMTVIALFLEDLREVRARKSRRLPHPTEK